MGIPMSISAPKVEILPRLSKKSGGLSDFRQKKLTVRHVHLTIRQSYFARPL